MTINQKQKTIYFFHSTLAMFFRNMQKKIHINNNCKWKTISLVNGQYLFFLKPILLQFRQIAWTKWKLHVSIKVFLLSNFFFYWIYIRYCIVNCYYLWSKRIFIFYNWIILIISFFGFIFSKAKFTYSYNLILKL